MNERIRRDAIKITEDKISSLLQEYSKKSRASGSRKAETAARGDAIAADFKKKAVFKRTLNDLCDKLLKKSIPGRPRDTKKPG